MTLLPWSLQIAHVGTLVLFGLNDNELLPDLHITRAGVLRAGLGAHRNMVDQDALRFSGGLLRNRCRFTQGRVGPLQDSPSLRKNVLTISTVC